MIDNIIELEKISNTILNTKKKSIKFLKEETLKDIAILKSKINDDVAVSHQIDVIEKKLIKLLEYNKKSIAKFQYESIYSNRKLKILKSKYFYDFYANKEGYLVFIDCSTFEKGYRAILITGLINSVEKQYESGFMMEPTKNTLIGFITGAKKESIIKEFKKLSNRSFFIDLNEILLEFEYFIVKHTKNESLKEKIADILSID